MNAQSKWIGSLLGLMLLLAGCQTPTMKGTPFYTGEYESPEEGYTDRVNLWPALYYRDPALSVLWPVFELTDEHAALRPVFSMYDRKSDTPTYNVCWPIARFDSGDHDNRIFPVFWGDEYFAIAPLYWHIDDPFNKDGLNALFPLWIWNAKPGSRRLDLLWPIYADKKGDSERLWRIWPLYGMNSRNNGESVTRFWAWPLGGSEKSDHVKKHYLFPLYYAGNKGLQSDLWTLLGGTSSGPEGFRWSINPVLSWGEKTDTGSKSRFLLGLAGSEQTDGSASSHLLPVYARRAAADSSYFFSLPYSSASAADGSSWSASLPLFHHQTDATGNRRLITPVYARKNDASGNTLWRCYFPLLYLDHSYDRHIMTLLGGWWKSGDNSGWLATPILSGGTQTADSEKTIWAAGLAGKKSTPEKSSHYVLPLYYTCPEENRFLSLPLLRWQTADQTRYTVIPPLLSGTARKGDNTHTVIAAGLAEWEKEADQLNSSSIIPLYGWKRNDHLFTLLYGKTDTATYFLTPLVGRYLNNEGGWIFPLWHHEASKDNEKTWLLLGTAKKYKNKIGSGHSIFPLYSTSHSASPNWQGSLFSEEDTPDDLPTWYHDNFRALLFYKNSRHELIDTNNYVLEKRSTAGLFPLWNHNINMPRNGDGTLETAELLLRLYDYRRITPKDPAEKTYTRHRILWRIFHKETVGNDSSTDIFPAITIDKKENGFRKTSFFWRLFRYEKDPETDSTKLDLLFLPLKR